MKGAVCICIVEEYIYDYMDGGGLCWGKIYGYVWRSDILNSCPI